MSEPFRPQPPPNEAETTERPSGVPPRHPHALAEAGGLTGAVAGAILGSIAGPFGAVAGGALGSALGAFTGEALSRAEHEREVHDRELDDTIGVTSGDLGTSEENKHPSPEALAEARTHDEARRET